MWLVLEFLKHFHFYHSQVPTSHLRHQGLSLPCIIVRSIIYRQLIMTLQPIDLIFTRVIIYPRPGERSLTGNFLIHLFYQGHYLPCSITLQYQQQRSLFTQRGWGEWLTANFTAHLFYQLLSAMQYASLQIFHNNAIQSYLFF